MTCSDNNTRVVDTGDSSINVARTEASESLNRSDGLGVSCATITLTYEWSYFILSRTRIYPTLTKSCVFVMKNGITVSFQNPSHTPG